jgi:hypothetical protein
MMNRSRAYNAKDTSGLSHKAEPSVGQPKSKPALFFVGDAVDVYSTVGDVFVWAGVVQEIKVNGVLTVEATIAKDKRGRLIRAKFSNQGKAVGPFNPQNRYLRKRGNP